MEGRAVRRNPVEEVTQRVQSRLPKRRVPYSTIRAAYQATIDMAGKMGARVRTAHQLGISIPTVIRAIKSHDKRKSRGGGSISTMGPGHDGRGRKLAEHHPAVAENRTLFVQARVPPEPGRLFKNGEHSAKLGAQVLKGEWKGFPIYTLTLEERATCPPCVHKLDCYGNNSPFSRRIKHGPEFEWMLEREVAGLELANPKGFLVRLHMLGDFYSWRYCDLWRTLMWRHPAMHVFGYTAHIDTENDVIARTLALMVRELWPRFALRFSNGDGKIMTTISIDKPADKPADAVICPAQLQQSESCSTCALCWSLLGRIAFLRH